MELSRNAKRDRINELYERYERIEPLAEKGGEIWVSFEDAAIINSVQAMENSKGTGMQTRNADGSLASTGKRVHAVNPDYFFANRCKKDRKKILVVSGHETTGYRCIKEQASGHVFQKLIPCYVIARNEEGNLFVEKLTNVEEREFISEFTTILDNALMAEILPLITAYGKEATRIDKMPI